MGAADHQPYPSRPYLWAGPATLSTLPVAGLSALRALRRFGPVSGKRVLITGATGGVGRFAVQLAHAQGPRLTADDARRARGADEGVPGPEHGDGDGDGDMDAVVDSVGGQQLMKFFAKLAAHGTLVAVGDVTSRPVTFPPGAFSAVRTGTAARSSPSTRWTALRPARMLNTWPS